MADAEVLLLLGKLNGNMEDVQEGISTMNTKLDTVKSQVDTISAGGCKTGAANSVAIKELQNNRPGVPKRTIYAHAAAGGGGIAAIIYGVLQGIKMYFSD